MAALARGREAHQLKARAVLQRRGSLALDDDIAARCRLARGHEVGASALPGREVGLDGEATLLQRRCRCAGLRLGGGRDGEGGGDDSGGECRSNGDAGT